MAAKTKIRILFYVSKNVSYHISKINKYNKLNINCITKLWKNAFTKLPIYSQNIVSECWPIDLSKVLQDFINIEKLHLLF